MCVKWASRAYLWCFYVFKWQDTGIWVCMSRFCFCVPCKANPNGLIIMYLHLVEKPICGTDWNVPSNFGRKWRTAPLKVCQYCWPTVCRQYTNSWPTANRHLRIWQVWWHRRHSTLIVLLESVAWCTTNWAKIASSYVLGKFIYEIAL